MSSRASILKRGILFFEIADLSIVWLYADIYEYEIPWIKIGQEILAESPSIPGKRVKGKITFIDPILDSKTKTVKIRGEFENKKGFIKPETFATVSILIPTPKGVIAIPKSAIIDTGLRKLVYLKGKNREFLGKRVSTGVEAEGYVQILMGLSEGDQVVVDASFLIDSQSQLSGGQEGLFGNTIEVNKVDAKPKISSEPSQDSAAGNK